ncbi:uncharacterized protein EI90DRAFT_2711306 [Cantharellus anzutake]|uniref:uncharacterized protein n=1 Tax=Cantharellus anzutake TaxID=1750568 RepID=UPI001904F476|nr:uncharacterized protein EI90DRAFT_2711306 [Cantharellus anzutake]KAF8318330.1 hypothetical protein EI90DRAFT_2711306 [Cantharellus anzutake]
MRSRLVLVVATPHRGVTALMPFSLTSYMALLAKNVWPSCTPFRLTRRFACRSSAYVQFAPLMIQRNIFWIYYVTPPPLSRPLYASASVPFFLLFRTCGYASAFVPSLLRSYCLVFVASSILLYSRGFGCGSDCKYFLVLLKGEGAVTFGFLCVTKLNS